MEQTSANLPDLNRLSVVSATVLLAYAVTPFIQIPARLVEVQLPGIFISITLTFSTLTTVLAVALAGLGTDWLLHDHPRYAETRASRHWLLPALTALIIGVPLNSLQVGLEWWAVFAFGGLMLAGVCAAEYIAADPSDARHALVSVVLSGVSFALFLVLAVALRGAGSRLYLILPVLTGGLFITVLRTLYLRLGGRWVWNWSIGIALVVGQMAMGLHYWPISPLQYGLILLGPAYVLTSLAASLEEGRSDAAMWIESALMLAALWGLAAVVRQ
jgi:hypothetical protein